MVPEITMDDGTKVYFTADLLPSSYHVRLPYVMSYDIRPLKCLEEKKDFYDKLLSHDKARIIFEHDPIHQLGELTINDRGRYGINTDVSLDY